MEYFFIYLYTFVYFLLCVVSGVIKESHRARLKSLREVLTFLVPILAWVGYLYVFPQQSKDWLVLGVFAPFVVSANLLFWLNLFFGKTDWYRSIWTNDKLDEKEKLGVFCFDFERFNLNIPVRRGDFFSCSDNDELYLNDFEFLPIEGLEFIDVKENTILSSTVLAGEGFVKSTSPDLTVRAKIYKFEQNDFNSEESVKEAIKKFLFIKHFLPDKVSRAVSKKSISRIQLKPWESLMPMCSLSYSSGYLNSKYQNYHSLHICSDNVLLELEFSVDSLQRHRHKQKTKDKYREGVDCFIGLIGIERKFEYLEYVSVCSSTINDLIEKEKFHDFFPSESEFSDLLQEHAEDPVQWYVFKGLPEFDFWFSRQYKKHCEIYEYKRKKFICSVLNINI